MQEEWSPVVGYEEIYEVSNMGRVGRIEATKRAKMVLRRPY
jgi:hypothetical protein